MKNQKTILVVDDDDNFRDIVVSVLESKHFTTLKAKNGAEGVELALAHHPDLIMLDMLMPEMDGMTAFKEIRQDNWGATVPVIILTNLDATDQRLVEDMVIQKPLFYLIKSNWHLNDIAKKIEEILGDTSS